MLYLPAALLSVAVLLLAPMPAQAAEFSVSPIRAEFKGGVLTETITVANEGTTPLRVTVKLMEWTQDPNGQDVYSDSTDLVYFPRELDILAGARRLIRVGAKAPAGTVERTYRLFIEEVLTGPRPPGTAQVAFFFRFGVPIFLTPAAPRQQLELGDPTLLRGKLSIPVRNAGNQHFRIGKLTVSDGASFSQDVPGWYSLAGSQRNYTADIPQDVCRRAKSLRVTLEGENGAPVAIERQLHVDPASCA